MALNEIFKVGKSISLPVPADTKSGDPVRVGVLNGVAIVDEGTGFNKILRHAIPLSLGSINEHNSLRLEELDGVCDPVQQFLILGRRLTLKAPDCSSSHYFSRFCVIRQSSRPLA